ncbi:class I SAM-dependent methyltransferase [Candidatus Omnitrophota bacterium]
MPDLIDIEINDNHKCFKEKASIYKKSGLDFIESRKFILNKAGPLHGNILEIGSGKGNTAISLARAGYGLISVDNDEEMVRIAALNLAYEKLLPKVELYVMDAYSLEFKENSFNNIFIIEALHHMDDIDRIFSEVERVLSKEGKLILADFNNKGRKIIEDVHASEGRKHESSSISRNEAQKWLLDKGYNCKEYDDICHWVIIANKRAV